MPAKRSLVIFCKFIPCTGFAQALLAYAVELQSASACTMPFMKARTTCFLSYHSGLGKSIS